MTALHRAARFLGLVPSRHCAGSVTGWACLARIPVAAPVEYFTRPRTTPLAVFPMAAPDYPYDPSKGSAA